MGEEVILSDGALASSTMNPNQREILDKITDTMDTHKYEEFICGWGAAFVNICVTFPINKVMFRQQLDGIKVCKAIEQLHIEGPRQLYRGLLPPLLQKTTNNAIMFGSYYKIQEQLNTHYPDMPLQINRTIAALLSGTLEAVLCPFERVQVLMQDRKYMKNFNNTGHAFKELSRYGIREYYRGLSAVLLRNGPSNVPFFLVRDYIMEKLPKADSNAARLSQDFLCGALLGACLSTIFYPLNVVKVRMQCKIGGDFDGIYKTFREVWKQRDRKIKKLFRGVHVNYTRSFISWGIINATYEFLLVNAFGKQTRLAET